MTSIVFIDRYEIINFKSGPLVNQVCEENNTKKEFNCQPFYDWDHINTDPLFEMLIISLIITYITISQPFHS